MRKITYYTNSGQRYAKIPGTSYREDGKVKKRDDGIYLGRVIDEKHCVFYTRERGLYTFDPKTGAFGIADETYVSSLPKDRRKRLNICLDFGDSYFLHSLLHSMGYDKVIDSFQYRNKDTLWAMIQYYVLRNAANVHAGIWYEGSIASYLYPNANITSQRISDFLQSIGRRDHVEEFFDAHIEWIKENICNDPAILIDSTGLPNSIHFPLTAISNHNGKISREVRMSIMLQRDSGYPLMFRLIAGNINDVSTITRSVQELMLHGIPTDFVLIDAGYFSTDNVDMLYEAGIDYLTRLPKRNRKLYQYILEQGLETLKKEQNLVTYNGRAVYIKQVECKVGNGDHPAYAYLGYDANRASDEIHKAAVKLSQGKISEKKFQKTMDHAGLFIIISSLPFKPDEILETYYIRQMIEQYFDISKGSSELTPLRIHSEEALYGHLILSTIASTINVHIMKTMSQYHEDKEALFMNLSNQKCIVHNTQITVCEANKTANEFYSKFRIKCPLYLERSKNELKPKYRLPKSGV